MEAQELKIHQIGQRQYVTLPDAAHWLHLSKNTLDGQIALGKLVVVRIESRQFIELHVLKTYAGRRKRQAST